MASYDVVSGILFLVVKRSRRIECVVCDFESGKAAYVGRNRFQGLETLCTWFGARGAQYVRNWISNAIQISDAATVSEIWEVKRELWRNKRQLF
jgi:hypothetical protein